jgi:hypothetical protein
MSDAHRPWREQLGAMMLSQLPQSEEAALKAHLDQCVECSAEAELLRPVVSALAAADVERVSASAPPPPHLEDRVFSRLAEARRLDQLRRRRFRTRLASGLAAAAVILAAVVVTNRGDQAPDVLVSPEGVELVSFTSLPPGAEAEAELTQTKEGMSIHIRMRGMPSGDWLVAVERTDGTEEASETFAAPSGGWSGSRTLPLERRDAIELKIRLADGTAEFVEPLP